MAYGFLKGVVHGVALSGAVAAVASVVADGPKPPEVVEQMQESAALGEMQPVATEQLGSGAARDRVPVQAERAPKTPVPDQDALASIARFDTLPAEQPETGGDALALPAPVTAESVAPLDTPSGELPVVADLPAQAERVTDGPIDQPTVPDASVSVVSVVPEVAETTEELPPAIATDSAPEAPGTEEVAAHAASPGTSSQPVAAEPPVAIDTTEAPQAPTAEVASLPSPSLSSEPKSAEIALPEPGDPPAASALEKASPAPEAPPAEVKIAALQPSADMFPVSRESDGEPQPPVAVSEESLQGSDENAQGLIRPSTGQDFAGTLGDRAKGVMVNRLPNLGGSAEPSTAEAGPAPQADPTDLPPLRQYASAFENPEKKPLMAIVLMDDGSAPLDGEIGLEALGSFPYPISFAVDASAPNAGERMRAYRDRGFEVLAMLDLPEAATARDAEVSVAAALGNVPEAVALLEGPVTGFQSTRAASDQVTAIVGQTGHGLVTQNKGLNTAQKLAVKEGVPAVAVFRDFDSKDQTPVVIRRFLDQAAFRSGQEGAVVMLGRLRPDTISALLLWGLQDRVEKVALAPISAVLAP